MIEQKDVAARTDAPRRADQGRDARETLLWRSPQITLGHFEASPQMEDFPYAGAIGNRPSLAFPRTAVRIRQEGHHAFVADPTLVVLYNPGQPFCREAVDPTGDSCEWIAVDPAILAGSRSFTDPERPFRWSHRPTAPGAYLALQLLVRHIERGDPDPLFVEERIVGLLAAVLPHSDREERSAPLSPRDRRRIEAVKELFAASPGAAHSLTTVAAEVGCSAYHLCRRFRVGTGYSLHAYLTQLRLRFALLEIGGAPADLSALAFDLGFSSHSHFTSTFRKSFGLTPSTVRRAVARPRRRELASLLRSISGSPCG